MNVDMASLNATLNEDIYPPVAKGMVLQFNKALYGLKQSPSEWNATLDKFVRDNLRMTRLKTKQIDLSTSSRLCTWMTWSLLVLPKRHERH